MAKKRVRLTFPENLIKEPIIYLLGREFAIVTNIRMADVDEHTGWVVLELDGDAGVIDDAIAWTQSKGVRVDPLVGDVIEG